MMESGTLLILFFWSLYFLLCPLSALLSNLCSNEESFTIEHQKMYMAFNQQLFLPL